MLIATWNLNNRFGKVRFRPEAASAAIALGADVLVFNEYYLQDHGATFAHTLHVAEWAHQEISKDTGEKANRVLIASRLPLRPLDIQLPDFDLQFPSNVLCVSVPSLGISIVGVRVPWYEGQDVGLVANAWEWLEATAASLLDQPSIILRDLNAGLKSNRSRGGDNFRSILQSGWHRAMPKETDSFYSKHGDHILGTSLCSFRNARYVTESGGGIYLLAEMTQFPTMLHCWQRSLCEMNEVTGNGTNNM
jgi:hypothetical protein